MKKTKYKHKKLAPEKQAWSRFHNSGTYKRLLWEAKEVEDNPAFRKELTDLKNRFPLRKQPPYNPNNETSDAWEAFCEKWKIKSMFIIPPHNVVMEWPIRIGIEINPQGVKKTSLIERCPMSEATYRDFLPIIKYNNRDAFGDLSSVGRPKGTKILERNKNIRKDFLSYRQRGITTNVAIEKLEEKYYRSASTITRHAYSRKLD